MRFLLVDRILQLESGKRATGIKNVTMSEDFLAYHFPEMPIMPGVLITESLVQLADWVVREHSDFKEMGVASEFKRVKFRHLVRPGDQLQLEVVLTRCEQEEVEVQGKASCNGKLVSAVDFVLTRQPVEPLLTVAESQRLFRIICPETPKGVLSL